MEKNLPVKYKSQWDADAIQTANDCGPTSIAMILNYFEGKDTYTSDQIFALTGAGKGVISMAQMKTALDKLGYTASFLTKVSVADLKIIIDAGVPVIALVHYGSLNSVQDKLFKGGHFFVVRGYRDDGYWVNDPNFQGSFRADGDNHFYTKAEFENAWNNCHLDGNNDNQLIVINKKLGSTPAPDLIDQHRNVTILPDQGANVRNTPATVGKNVVNTLNKGTVVAVDGFVKGEVVESNPYWWKLKDANLYIWSGITNVVPTMPAANPVETPKPIEPVSDKSKEQLQNELAQAKEDLKRISLNGADKDTQIIDLQKQITDLKDKVFTDEETVKEIQTYKTTNEELSKQLQESGMAYTAKIGELKEEIVTSKSAAFVDWTLIEIPAGSSALTKIPLLVSQLLILIGSIMKNGYVIGWKKGGKLVRVDQPMAPTTGHQVSKLLE